MVGIFRKITIRTNILTNILIVVTIVAGVLLWLQYRFSQTMVLDATRNSFADAAGKITLHLQDGDRLAKTIIDQMELYPGLTSKPKRPLPFETIRRFSRTMQSINTIYAIYLGYPDGDLFEVVNMKMDERLYKIYRAPLSCRWMVIRVYDKMGKRVREFLYLDKSMHLIGSRSEPSNYGVTVRPWYLQAMKSDKAVRSAPYLFSNLGEKGITYSKKVEGSETVIALDLTLDEMNRVLKEQVFAPTAKIVMFDHNGSVIASSDGSARIGPMLYSILQAGDVGKVVLSDTSHGREFVMVTELSEELGKNSYLGFSVDAETMLAPYMQKIYYAFGAAFIALLLSIPLIFFTTSRIVRPIKALMYENEKIKARRYDEVRPVKTNIIELIELSESLISLSRSIQAYEKSLKDMMHAFIRLIADAIDAKSPYTGGHCKRVPEIARMLAEAAEKSDEGECREFAFKNDEEFEAFEMGAWLHDCGKITTPEFVVDKATKLETIHNRIHEIRTRFEVVWRDIDIEYYIRLLAGEEREKLAKWKEEEHKKLLDDFAFVAACNIGGEFMDEEKKNRIKEISERRWMRHFDNRIGLSEIEKMRLNDTKENDLPAEEKLLSDRPEHLVERVGFDEEEYDRLGFKLEVPTYLYNQGEIYNLCVEKGTLTPEERFKIEEHVIMTIRMLERLPYPKSMKRIPEYAGTHHETVDGTGYPRRLSKEELSIPARIMAIADIFEALTASDRPYKKAKKLSEALQIMAYMVKNGHLDGELFTLFLEAKIYKKYARKYLEREQIDDVDVEALLGIAHG
ncbi:HD domain-containing phosphohydrolase [Hydrogenimonas cancrithermarum]|uniref:HD-GYP domain-containing protein n=1 Tax=Hydrogenimonas cancrithermarum TaxID=2993563 RepID=A0ABN6WVN4_9BACT|nr:HD domain-containing phosphohydrolase [Hydrogenimonas cancrithermarum]BDY13076.1 hypothetical protein HCR_13880 [Hydrogenimonas cancrithermarum]